MDIKNRKLTEEEFFKERKEVLAEWPTGKDVDLEEAVAYHRNLPPNRVMAKKMEVAKQKGEAYTVTGMGKATIEEHMQLLQYVQKEGQAQMLGTSVDSFSRVPDFAASEKGLKESIKRGKSVLNGVPVVVHGVSGIRKLMESIDCPVQMSYSAMDPRLIEEIAIAGGHTGTCGDGIYSFWNMNKKLPIEYMLSNYRYVHRLVGYYEERGAPISLSVQGMYDGGAVPPSLVDAAIILQMPMIAEQGGRNILIHYHARGNLIQDIAGSNVVRKLGREYLDKFGYKDVVVTSSTALALLKYPVELGSSFAVNCLGSIAAVLCGAQVNDIRTPSEAVTIPTKEDTAIAYRCANMVMSLFKNQKIRLDSRALKAESEREELETRLIVDKVLELGDGDVMVGTVRAVQMGVLDNPFATNSFVPCKVMGIKDIEGAVRYLDTGNLPFTKDIIEFHKAKIAEREKKQGCAVDYETIIRDIASVSRGYLVE
jgi:methylaspartate mutase epsilon subunit